MDDDYAGQRPPRPAPNPYGSRPHGLSVEQKAVWASAYGAAIATLRLLGNEETADDALTLRLDSRKASQVATDAALAFGMIQSGGRVMR